MSLKKSVCIEMAYPELNFYDRIRKVAEIGYPAIEFWSWTNKDIKLLKKSIKEAKISVAAYCGNSGGSMVDKDNIDNFQSGLQESINIAKELECKTLITTAGDIVKTQGRLEQEKTLYENLCRATDIIEKEEITLVLEPLNVLVNHPTGFLSSSKESFNLVRLVNSSKIKVLYDIYHQQITEGNIIDTICCSISLIGHFHSAGVPGRNELYKGELNYSEILRKIESLDYDGYFGLEFIPREPCDLSLKKIQEM